MSAVRSRHVIGIGGEPAPGGAQQVDGPRVAPSNTSTAVAPMRNCTVSAPADVERCNSGRRAQRGSSTFTRALLKRTMTMRLDARGCRAGWSKRSKASRLLPGSFLKGRQFSSCSSSAIAVFSSAKLKKRRLRRRARIQHSTTSTVFSTFGLSLG